MRNFWLVAKHEYRKRVGARSFLLATLGAPALMGLMIGISLLTATSNQNDKSLGWVDEAGILNISEADSVELRAFPDEASARQALEQAEIQAYYVLPPDYLESRQIQMYYWDKPPSEAASQAFARSVRAGLASGLPSALQPRLIEDPSITVRNLDGSRVIGSGNVWGILLPFVAAFLFFFAVMTSAGYLLQVVADEKENRTIEILITTLSPEQLIAGKAAGLMGVSLTQLGVWILTLASGLILGAQYLEPLKVVQLPWSFVVVALLFSLPAYVLVAAIMTAIGGATTEMRQGQQIAGILNLLFILPMLLSGLVFANPDSPLLVFFTLFPTTSFVTVMLRWATSAVPSWQMAASWIFLTGSAFLGMWASARIFRAGMLRYGQRLELGAILSAIHLRIDNTIPTF